MKCKRIAREHDQEVFAVNFSGHLSVCMISVPGNAVGLVAYLISGHTSPCSDMHTLLHQIAVKVHQKYTLTLHTGEYTPDAYYTVCSTHYTLVNQRQTMFTLVKVQ